MFGISFSELILIILVSVLIIRPKDLPEILAHIRDFTSKIKSFKDEVMLIFRDINNQLDISQVKKNIQDNEIFTYRGRNYILDLDGNIRELFDLKDDK